MKVKRKILTSIPSTLLNLEDYFLQQFALPKGKAKGELLERGEGGKGLTSRILHLRVQDPFMDYYCAGCHHTGTKISTW